MLDMSDDEKRAYLKARQVLAEGPAEAAQRAFLETFRSHPTSERIAAWGLVAARQFQGPAALDLALAIADAFPDNLRYQQAAIRAAGASPGDAADPAVRLARLHGQDVAAWAHAAKALRHAGRTDEANAAWAKSVALRAVSLPSSLKEGFASIRHQALALDRPARANWAWSYRQAAPGDPPEPWLRSFHWGNHADRLLRHWLEAAPDRVDEIADLVDLEGSDRIRHAVSRERGVLLANAHLGPLHGSVVALVGLGLPWNWVASSYPDGRTEFGRALLSTMPHPDWALPSALLEPLKAGRIVWFPLDGSLTPEHRRLDLCGQGIPINPFGSLLVRETGCAALWVTSRWEGGRIRCIVEDMPEPRPDESSEAFVERWNEAYLAQVKRGLRAGPENLKGAGGFWENIR